MPPVENDRAERERSIGRTMADLQASIDADDQALADHLGIGRTDLRCLDIVFRQGPQPVRQLARLMRLTPGSVTTMTDRLIAAGYVHRVPDPTHGRRVLVTPTPHCVEIITELFGDRVAEAHAALARFDDAQLAAIEEFLGRSVARHTTSAEHLQALGRRPRPGR
ncbi:MarR family transcriptional regulator [Tsukamurella sp. NPDC003166]|uniref:MarR family winged helix-turn-helix transcriptional regulator n=1 Tax=Tsukamurella sp. NPDC003166 TaxID=3154444 RepID=UPI0033BCE053